MLYETVIIALANNKGGVGKTTTALNLGTGLGRRGYKVLLIDLDAQCCLTENLIDFAPEASVYDAFLGPKSTPVLKRCVIPGARFMNPLENVDLLPAVGGLNELELMLAGKTLREKILDKILRNLEVRRHYEFVIIDCPPALNLLTKNALTACNQLYVPTTAEYTPVAGLVKLQEKCEEIAEELNPDLRINGIIVTRYSDGENLQKAADESLRQSFGDIVFSTRVRKNVTLAEAPQKHMDIFQYDPSCNGATDYGALLDEVEQRFEL